MLVGINRTLKRNKVFDAGRVQGRIVAALGGIEVLSSYSRCCDSCLERRVTVRKNGVKTEQVQYYHRAVGCQIVSSPVKSFLAFEWLQPNEGEETAALRLLRKLPDLYGSPFFNILLLDALYAQTAVLDLVQEIGWDVVISLKQNQPDLYKSAVRLFGQRAPDTAFTEQRDHKTYEVLLWDKGLPFSGEDPRLVRVLRSEETLTENQTPTRANLPRMFWITTLDPKLFPRLRFAGWVMIDGGWRTMAGTISLSTGP